MRLGAYPCDLKEGSKAREIYGVDSVEEGIDIDMSLTRLIESQFEDAGMIATGINPVSGLVEIVEIPEHLISWLHNSTQNTLLRFWLHTLYLLHLLQQA